MKNFSQMPLTNQENNLFSTKTLAQIKDENLFNLWVPKNLGGLECSLEVGLQKLQALAKIDGSLGWTVTLCSGANFFVGNLIPQIATDIFMGKKPCFGGSGGVFGTANRQENGYVISGKWKYATGAPYLTHFTLNAALYENGIPLLDASGAPQIKSFVLPKNEVKISDDWHTMGLKATATQSFLVEDVWVSEDYSFVYDTHYLPQSIFKIDFQVFADLTLWANYLGMAQHFLALANRAENIPAFSALNKETKTSEINLYKLAKSTEKQVDTLDCVNDELKKTVHDTAAQSVHNLSQKIIDLFPYIGINGCASGSEINIVFTDYFTATQHHNFIR